MYRGSSGYSLLRGKDEIMAGTNSKEKKTNSKELFSGFGEFDSAEQINMAAEGLKKEGDKDSLYKLAKENGIDKEDATDYLDGYTTELATDYTAAIGKLDMELKVASEKVAHGVIVEMTKQLCTELEFARAVRKKGKRVGDIFNILRNEAGKHKSGSCGVSCGTDRQLFGIITAYYLEGKKAAEKKVAELY